MDSETLQGQVSEYRVFDFIASGGFASVFFGRDIRNNVSVALKRLHPHLSTQEEIVERFEKEANTVRGLVHPNIVRLLDHGRDGKGVPFIVMEWVTGNTVGNLLKERGPFQPSEAADVACQALDGLQAAWDRRVVHRDVKPANLMVDANGNVKVMDFGVAKEFDMATLVGTAGVIGTPAYMAPEQLDGRPLDCRVDLYAMGITLYQMISGLPPFRGPSLMDFQRQHTHEEPPPLTGIDRGLWQVLARSLAKQPEDRFRVPAEMVQALLPYAGPGDNMATQFSPRVRPAPTQGSGPRSYPPTPYPVTPATPSRPATPAYPAAGETAWVGDTAVGGQSRPGTAVPGRRLPIVPIAVAAVVVIAAAGIGLFALRPSAPSPVPTPAVAATSNSQNPTGTQTGNNSVLLQESLTNRQGQMPRLSEPASYVANYDLGYYNVARFRDTGVPNPLIAPLPSGPYTNTLTAVDAQLSEGTAAPTYYIALVCRDQTAQGVTSSYQFHTYPATGKVRLVRVTAGQVVDLVTPTTASSIKTGTANNRYELLCDGSKLSARVNNVEVATTSDSSFGSGGLGIGVGADRDGPPTVNAAFRNLAVSRP